MNDSDKFSYTYSAPTEEERREIEDIRRAYAPATESEDKLTKIRTLNERATRPARIAALTLGIGGILLFGLGMSMTLAWELIAGGIVVAAIGMLATIVANPVRRALLNLGKRKYGAEILRLTDELLGEKNTDK